MKLRGVEAGQGPAHLRARALQYTGRNPLLHKLELELELDLDFGAIDGNIALSIANRFGSRHFHSRSMYFRSLFNGL